MEITAIPMPSYDHLTENPAEVGTAAWLAAYGGTDVTYKFPDDDDYGHWVGDWQAPNGEIYRLLLDDRFGKIHAYELKVQFNLGEPDPGDHIWSGKEWLAETRDEDAIRADILADLDDDDDADGEFITILGEPLFYGDW